MAKKVLLLSATERKQNYSDKSFEPVMIESPLGGDFQGNIRYARLCMLISVLKYNEAPMAFHLLYPQSLCDDTDIERKIGIERSFLWHSHAAKKIYFVDRGFSQGMLLGYVDAVKKGIPVEIRTLSDNVELNSCINAIQNKTLNDDELKELRCFLLDLQQKTHDKWKEQNDIVSFRERYQKELFSIDNCSKREMLNCPLVEYARICMRESLIVYGDAPLVPFLFDRQLFNNETHNGLIEQEWGKAAEKIDVFVDKGITNEISDILNERGFDIPVEFKTIRADNKSLINHLNKVNKIVHAKDKIDYAIELFNHHNSLFASTNHDFPINNRKLIANLNGHNYKSKEREFNSELSI